MSLPYMIYKRVRSSIGVTLGFILMYGMMTNNLNATLLITGAGFLLIHLFGDLYNDSVDYSEDVRNRRKDKLTVSGLCTPMQIMYISLLLLFLGMIILYSIDPILLFSGAWYAALLFAYSYPGIRLKKFHALAYAAIGFTSWSIIMISLSTIFNTPLSLTIILLSIFSIFQYMYLLCQKDSTDKKDETNLFLANKRLVAWSICTACAMIALASLMALTFSFFLIPGIIFNMIAKILNLSMIYHGTITRVVRERIMLMEFATPYIFLLVFLLM